MMDNKRKRRFRRLWIALGTIAVVILIALFAASEYMLSFALQPEKNKGRNYARELAVMKGRYPWIRGWVDSLQRVNGMRDTFAMSPDGDRHHALIIQGRQKTDLSAVVVPGYTDCAIDMLHIAYIYNNVLGMNVIIPDLHANGKSEGKAMQMGWKDRADVIRCIALADSLFHDAGGRSRIVVHGQSMGAATVMNVSGELAEPVLPELVKDGAGQRLASSVRCYVEDCGYTSAWDEFSYEITELFGLHDFPLMYTASALCKLQYGWTFGEAAPARQVAKCLKPMLFIHGGSDDFVPTRMVYSLYKAKPAPKYLYVFPGSKHARSYCDHRRAYEDRILTFVGRYIGD